jgi:hypothetical protein
VIMNEIMDGPCFSFSPVKLVVSLIPK